MKRFFRNWIVGALLVFVFMLLFAKEKEIMLFAAIGLVVGGTIALAIESGCANAKSGKKKVSARVSTVKKNTREKPLYIYRPFDNRYIYRIEWQHGRQYVFERHSNRYIYRIEGDKIYRGSETKVYYQLKGNKVYRALDNKDPVYRIEGDKVYQGNFGTRPVFTIGTRAVK